MLQIKNTLGGGKPEGLYAWKKYNVVHVNGSATFSCVGSSSLSIKNANFDITSIDDYVSFFNGFKVSDTEYYFNVNADGKLVFNVNSTTSFIVNKFDGTQTSSQFSLSAICSAFTQTLSEENGKVISYEFIDYIVSDKETAYPDGGEKDGYWYEKVSEAKVASGEITFSSAVNTITIEHGLGAKPKYVFLIGIKKETDRITNKLINGYKDNESSRIITMQSFSDGTSGFKPTSAISGELTASTFAEIEADATNITMPVSYVYDTQAKYTGTYKWFAIA